MLRAGFASANLLPGLFACQLPGSASQLPAAESCGSLITKRWATKKQGGSTKNSPDSHPKHLGVKMNEGQLVFPGQIILRQRGTKFHPGQNVFMGKDHTIHSKVVGFVKFSECPFVRLNIFKRRRFAHVVPQNKHWELDVAGNQEEMATQRTAIKEYISTQYRKCT